MGIVDFSNFSTSNVAIRADQISRMAVEPGDESLTVYFYEGGSIGVQPNNGSNLRSLYVAATMAWTAALGSDRG